MHLSREQIVSTKVLLCAKRSFRCQRSVGLGYSQPSNPCGFLVEGRVHLVQPAAEIFPKMDCATSVYGPVINYREGGKSYKMVGEGDK